MRDPWLDRVAVMGLAAALMFLPGRVADQAHKK